MSTLLALAALALAQERFPVVRVVDGDTIWVERAGEVEKLRLLSVDTEEKIAGQPQGSPTKPETVFGHETMLWAQDFFSSFGSPAQVGLEFPGGEERRDVYGRLLCHVILPDGRDYNLLLVELGKSPYFTKYGFSRDHHRAFVRAEEAARGKELGIWNPGTNRAGTPGAPSARRPYERLLPWWDARAHALAEFERRRAAGEPVFAADVPEDLARALELCREDTEKSVQVFGELDRFFDEGDGSLTALFRSAYPREAFRASLPAPRDSGLVTFLRGTNAEMTQNYLLVRGRLLRGARGFRMVAGDESQWELAGPLPETLSNR